MRELTDRGRDDIAFGCHQFHHLCEQRDIPHPGRLLYSRWVRATQTAEIIGSAFNHASREDCDALIPGVVVADVESELLRYVQSEPAPWHLLLVSHQPLVSRLVDHLVGEPGLVPPLQPGGLATLQMETVGRDCASCLFSAQPPNFEVDH